jgi:CheY-like chemotaxis protein
MQKKSQTSNKHYEPLQNILWVDDDIYDVSMFALEFLKRGISIEKAVTADDAIELLEKKKGKYDLAILDVRLPPGKVFSSEMTHGGFETGVALGALIKKRYPKIPVIGFSVCHEDEAEWFTKYGDGYIKKSITSTEGFYSQVETILKAKQGIKQKPRVFIVHGHDDITKLELKNYLQNTLNLGEPIILHEQANLGRTIIEKFEEETSNIDIVFVILTPDDFNSDVSFSNNEKRRSRQNVIFELGYFFAKMNRRSGKIILCYKKSIELPSDISGIIYIDISEGIYAASENIRLELKRWL